MSPDNGDAVSRPASPHAPRHQRPEFERRSLFADMDHGSAPRDDDLRSVRILSTLESARRPPRESPSRAHRRKRSTQRPDRAWTSRTSLALMAVGMLGLLISFVVVVQNGHSAQIKASSASLAPSEGRARHAAATHQAVASPSGAPLVPSPAHKAATTSAAPAPRVDSARIETLADAPNSGDTAPATGHDPLAGLSNPAGEDKPVAQPRSAPSKALALERAPAPLSTPADAKP